MNAKYYVYILTNNHNKVLYTGVTDNIAKRTFEHSTKFYSGFTKKYNVNKLVYYEELTNSGDASAIELINSINPEWVDLTFKVNQIESE